MKDIYILAIESSCDETSVSIIKNGCDEIATVVLSQMDKRNAPKPQYEQLEQIRERWKILSKGI